MQQALEEGELIDTEYGDEVDHYDNTDEDENWAPDDTDTD